MLYVDINDICRAFLAYATKIINNDICKDEKGLGHIVNVCWSKPLSIFDLALLVKQTIVRLSKGRLDPEINIIDQKKPILYKATDKKNLKVDIDKIQHFLGIRRLTNPSKTIERLVKACLKDNYAKQSLKSR
jgi:UDP-glucose 4-epimerase